MSADLASWAAIGLYLLMVVALVGAILAIAHWLAPPRHRPVKDMPYESGMDPLGDARQRFDIRFYLIAILFLLFDVELLFLYPWAVSAYEADGLPTPLRDFALAGCSSMVERRPSKDGLPTPLRDFALVCVLSFLGLLVIGLAYEWAKGGFRWR